MTAQEERHIRDLVNAYSRSADADRFRDYGNDIEITENTPYYITDCCVDSQLDCREVEKHEQPYTGSPLKALTVTSLSQVDRWMFDVGPLSRGRFQNVSNHLTVPGSEYVETCHTCRGDGKVNCPTCTGKGSHKGYHKCPECRGSGEEDCSKCNGSGSISVKCPSCGGKGGHNETRTRSKNDYKPYRDSSGVHYRLVTVHENYSAWVPCSRCNGSATVSSSCGRCGGRGKVKCSRCNGHGEVPCQTCSATGRVVCNSCDGQKKLLHSLRIEQTLEKKSDNQLYISDAEWNEVKQFPWREQCRTEVVFEKVDNRLAHNIYPENEDYNDSFNEFIDAHTRIESQRCHIRFQRAAVIRFHFHRVQYDYKGNTYAGYILGNTFFPLVSPITEYAGQLIHDAESSLKHRSAVDARRKLKEAQSLHVEGTDSTIDKLLEKVNAHLNVITRLGLKIMFWLVVLFATPFVFQYYDAINPVLPYASFLNSSDWFAYDHLPAAQCIIFIFFLYLTKAGSVETDYSKLDYNHALVYLARGMGEILLYALVIFVLLAAVNYLGLGILTSIAMWLLWWVIKIVFFIVVVVIALVMKLF